LNTFSQLAPASLWSCTARSSKLPKAIHDQEITYLFFGNDNKLWRITAISSSFENDPYGNGAKSRYDELVGILSEKYGRGTSVHQFGDDFYKRPDPGEAKPFNPQRHAAPKHSPLSATMDR
jgi:hypothetical protein